MGKKSRTKGACGERELVALATECGFESAKRTAPMQAGGYSDEFGDVSVPGIYAEAKRYKRTPIARFAHDLLSVDRPGLISVLFSRDDGKPWLATLDARELLKLHARELEQRSEILRLRVMNRDLEDALHGTEAA